VSRKSASAGAASPTIVVVEVLASEVPADPDVPSAQGWAPKSRSLRQTLGAPRGVSDEARSIGGIQFREFPHETFQILRVRGHG
jgi:hypothetical protein